MLILPAIDLFGGQAVRLVKGDYDRMTVYSPDPRAVAADFARQGAKALHLVDLEGARSGETPHLQLIAAIRAMPETAHMQVEVGGGIRHMDTIARYIEEAGVDRVILGSAAVTDPTLVDAAVALYGEQIAVGVDSLDGRVAIHGWQEGTTLTTLRLCRRLEAQGVSTIIATDIGRDGMLGGSNQPLYAELIASTKMRVIASGGVSTAEDVRQLKALGAWGAIIGKAYYTGALKLSDALEAAV